MGIDKSIHINIDSLLPGISSTHTHTYILAIIYVI